MFELPSHWHPMAVHFPIALFILALGFEMASLIFKNEHLHRSAIHMYVTAALITPLVVRTGVREADKLNLSHPLLDQHSQYAFWLMWISLMSLPVLWFVHKEFQKYFKMIFCVFLICSAILVSFTGDRGGVMVFEYGVGIEE